MRECIVESAPLETSIDVCERKILGLLDSATARGSMVVTVRGMPGSGVTAILRRATREARRRGLGTVYVSLDEWEAETPYAALEHLCRRADRLRPLLDGLEPGADPVRLGRQLVERLEAVAGEEPQPLVLVVDELQHCDVESAAVLRYVVTHLADGGLCLFGDSLARPTALSSVLTRFGQTDPSGRLLVLPDLDAEDIAVLVTQRTGTRIGRAEAERLRYTAGARYEAVLAFLESVDHEQRADLAAIRALPRVTSARLLPYEERDFAALRPASRLAAELLALHPEGVSLQTLSQTAARLEIPLRGEDPADGRVVVKNALTGVFQLRDPLSAPDIAARIPASRERRIHAVLADLTYGAESHIHWIASLEEVGREEAEAVLAAVEGLLDAREIEAATEVAYHAAERARGGEQYRRLLRAFGFACIQTQQAPAYQQSLSDIGAFAAEDPAFAYLYAYLRTFRAHGRLDAEALRRQFIEAPTQDVDHAFMQADIAALELVSALQTDPARGPEALEAVLRRFLPLVGERPRAPELQWLHPESRMLLAQALTGAMAGAAQPADPEAALVETERLAEAARMLPAESSEAVDVLTIAAMGFAQLDRPEQVVAAVRSARERSRTLVRPTLLPGQLDIVELELGLRSGDWERTRELIGPALTRAFDGLDMPTRVVVPAIRSWLHTVSGDFELAQRYLDLAKSSDRYRYPGYAIDFLAVAEVELLWHRDGARTALDALDALRREPRNARAFRLWGLRFDLLAELGDAEGMRVAWEEFRTGTDRPFASKPGHIVWMPGRVRHALGDYTGAIEAFEAATAQSDSAYHLGKSELGLASAYWRLRGHHQEVRAALERAVRHFESIGAHTFIGIARKRAEFISGEAADRIAALTVRERQVAMLAAQGWRNKEIASELRIGPATVAFHLSNAFDKLKVSKRSELGGVLR